METTQANVMPATIQSEPQFGNGRYSKVMKFAFEQSQKLFNASLPCAEHLAREVARQVGVIMKEQQYQSDIKIGKVNKSGEITVAEVAQLKTKGIKSTPELALFHALQWWQDAGKHGYSYANTKLVLDEVLTGELARLERETNE